MAHGGGGRLALVQPIVAGLVAGVTGFASSFALVIAGLRHTGADEAQASSGLLVVAVVTGVLGLALSLATRLPIAIVWSTPGAALLLASDTTAAFRDVVGAMLLAGALIAVTGMWPWLARLVTRIPKPIASAMLAGILFPICLAPVQAAVEWPLLALPIILTWLVLARFAPRWAVPAAVLVTIVVVAVSSAGVDLGGAAPVLVLTAPGFDLATVLGVGLPLYFVTMAGQNVPGIAVLQTFGYERVPVRSALGLTGLGTALAAPFGGIPGNLAAITAAMVAGPDAAPERERRWIAAVAAGATMALLGLGAGLAAAIVTASPPIIITAVAGLALLGALVASISSALEDVEHRLVAIVTFLVAVSGISIAGVGSPFWALLVGGTVMLLFRRPRRTGRRTGG